MGVMTNRIKPEKMRNATLSEETKDYLVAYRMVEKWCRFSYETSRGILGREHGRFYDRRSD